MDAQNQLIHDKWEQVKREVLRTTGITQVSFKTWIEPLEIGLVSEAGTDVYYPGRNEWAIKYIMSHYRLSIQMAMREVTGLDVNVRIKPRNTGAFNEDKNEENDMPLNKKNKLKIIKDYTEILHGEVDEVWFCDDISRGRPHLLYPGYRWGDESVMAELRFRKKNFIYYSGRRVLFDGVAFFPSRAMFFNEKRSVLHIFDDEYCLLTTVTKEVEPLVGLMHGLSCGGNIQSVSGGCGKKGVFMEMEPVSSDIKIWTGTPVQEEYFPKLDSNLNPAMIFGNMDIFSGNKYAFDAARLLSECPCQAHNPLLIYGKSGAGKTHLLNAVGNAIIRIQPTARVLYATSESFIDDLRFTRRAGGANSSAFKAKYLEQDVLILDDIQKILRKKTCREDFFNTLISLHHGGKMIILSASKAPMHLDGIQDRFEDLFEMGLICRLAGPDHAECIALLRSWAKECGVSIDNDLCEYVVSKVGKNVGTLKYVFTWIRAYMKSGMSPRKITESVERVLKHIVDEGQTCRVNGMQTIWPKPKK